MKKKVIIDTDVGIDDAFAIAYASQHLDILGLTSVHGNHYVEQTTYNCHAVIQEFGIDCDVYKGASRALTIPFSDRHPAVIVHGEDGLGNAAPKNMNYKQNTLSAVEFIINQVRANPNEVTIIAIGPLTNIALAISLAPDIQQQIKQLIIMGGGFGFYGQCGNMTPFAEFNIASDPHAADQVLKSNINCVVVPIDITHKVLVKEHEMVKIASPMLRKASEFYIHFHRTVEGHDNMVFHDATAVAYAINPDWFTTTAAKVRVSCDGITSGQTLLNTQADIGFEIDPFIESNSDQLICKDVNVESIKAHIFESLK